MGYFNGFGLFWSFRAILAVLGYYGCFGLFWLFWAILVVLGYFACFGLLWLFGPFASFWAFFGSGLVLSGALNSVRTVKFTGPWSCNTGGIGLDWIGWDIFGTTTTTRAPAVLKSCSIFLSCTCQCLQSSILLTSCVG